MKITRKEFKELVELYKEVNETANKYAEVIKDEVVENLSYPAFDWITKKLGINEWFLDLCEDGYITLEYDGVVEYCSDLDKIYDVLSNEN